MQPTRPALQRTVEPPVLFSYTWTQITGPDDKCNRPMHFYRQDHRDDKMIHHYSNDDNVSAEGDRGIFRNV